MAQFSRQVVALHTIVRTVTPGKAATKDSAAVKPVTQEIGPGTVFVVDDETDFNTLMSAKAISTDTKQGRAALSLAPTVDGPGIPTAPKDDDSPMSDEDRASWVERGKKVNVNVGDNWKPATIRKKVVEAETAAAAQAAKDANAGGGSNDLI